MIDFPGRCNLRITSPKSSSTGLCENQARFSAICNILLSCCPKESRRICSAIKESRGSKT